MRMKVKCQFKGNGENGTKELASERLQDWLQAHV